MSEQEWRDEFSRVVRKKMREKEITQAKLAEMSGVSEVSMSRYINGSRTPNGYVVEKIINALR